MTVEQIAASRIAAGAGTTFPAATTTATAGAGDPTAFAAALQRELAAGAAAVGGADDAVATPMAHTSAAAATPVTFGQMLALSTASATGDASAGPALLPAGASALAQAAAAQAAAAPIATPVSAPATPGGLVLPVEGRFSSPFGMRTHPISGGRKMHTGLDIAAPTGTPIKAAAGGTVSFAGVRGGYGNVVIVDHADGSQTYYAHAHELKAAVGDRVDAGQVIATVGSTGNSTGPHLHFELRRGGEPVDAAPLLGLSR